MRRSRPSGSQTQAPWAAQLPPPGLSWRRRLRSLGTEQSPGKRSLSSSSRRAARHGEAESPAPGAGCWGGGGGVRTGEKGWGAGLLRRLPGRSGDTNAGHRSRCPGCGAATTPPENTVQSFPALRPRNPSLCPSGSQTLLNLTLPCGLRCWRPKDASSPTPGSWAPVRSLSSLSLASSSWIHPQRPVSESSFGGEDPS